MVGGTGIAVPLSYLEALTNEQSKTTRIHIVWAVREHGFLADVLQHDFRRIFQERDIDDRVMMTVHITQEDADENKDGELGDGIKHFLVKEGRPEVCTAVEEMAIEGGKSDRGLAVVACGPSQMADDARRACVKVLGKGYRGVEYFEESFKW